MNTELLRRVERIDPTSADAAIPDEVWDAETAFEELRRRVDLAAPQHRLSSRVPRRRRWGWAVAVASAAAVLLLIGGVAWLSRGSSPTEDLPVVDQIEEPVIEEPAETEEPPTEGDGEGQANGLLENLPADIESGTFDTPVGQVAWVHLTADEGPLPGFGDPMTWPSGFAIFDAPRLWVSDDGIEWRVHPLPLDPAAQDATLTHVDDVYWLISSDPNGLWRSTDGDNWDELDPAGLLPPGPVGLTWTTRWGPPVTSGALTISHASFGADFPFDDYLPLLIEDYEPSGGDESCGVLRESEPGVYQIVNQEGDQPCPRQLALRFEETDTGLLVRDHATGEELGELLGVDLSHIERLAREGDGYGEELLWSMGDAGITPMETPWPATLPGEGRRLQAMFGTQDAIYAYVRESTGQVSVWRTNDGRSWSDLGPPALPGDLQFAELANDRLVAWSHDANTAWETTDGINWLAVDLPPLPEAGENQVLGLVPLDTGWFAVASGPPRTGETWWMQTGNTWYSLTELANTVDANDEFGYPMATGDTTFFPRGSDLWILRHDQSE